MQPGGTLLRPGSGHLAYRADLDGLRAICCVAVLLEHVAKSHATLSSCHWLLVFRGWIGVDVFFVLSGFLITTLLLEEENKYGSISLKKFYIRREFRIVPAYYVAIIIYGLTTLIPSGRQYLSEFCTGFPYWVFYLLPPKSVGTFFGHVWSLAYEQRFYLVWPLLFFKTTKNRQLRYCLLGGTMALLCGWPGTVMRSYGGLLLGCVVAVAYMSESEGGKLGALLRKVPTPALLPLVAAGFAAVFMSSKLILVFTTTIAVLVYSLTVRDSWLKSLLGIKPLQWLGKRSYSFYLMHVLCLNVILRVIRPTNVPLSLVVVALAIAVTAAVSAVIYVVIEEPMRKLGRSISSAKKPAPSTQLEPATAPAEAVAGN